MHLIRIAAALAAFGCAGAVSAQSVALDFGTTGIGVEGGYGFSEYIGVRGSYGAGTYNYDFTKENIRYDAKIKPSVGLLTADVHPFGGVFRLSAGLGYNNTKVDGTADSTTGTITINGVTYTTSQVGTVQGEVHFDKSAPYAGFGWGNAAKSDSGWFFTSDFGVLFSKAKGSVTGTCAASISAAQCAQLQSDLQAESQSFLREVEKVKYYPVVRIGVGYRF